MFDELFASLPADGWLTREEAELLWNAAARTKGDILEVGCYCGRSTVLLASLGRLVHCVDPFDGFHSDWSGDAIAERWAANTRGLPVKLHRVRVEDWELQAVGFAYLDGDHTYIGTLDQIQVALKCGAKTIAIHDVNDSGGGADVKRAALSLLGPWLVRVGRLALWSRE